MTGPTESRRNDGSFTGDGPNSVTRQALAHRLSLAPFSDVRAHRGWEAPEGATASVREPVKELADETRKWASPSV